MDDETRAPDPPEAGYGALPPRRPGAQPAVERGDPIAAVRFSAARYWAPGTSLGLGVAVAFGLGYLLLSLATGADAIGPAAVGADSNAAPRRSGTPRE